MNKFSLSQKILAFVKDEGSNLHTFASVMTSIVSCNNLGLLKPFDGICFKQCQRFASMLLKMKKKLLVYLQHPQRQFNLPCKNAFLGPKSKARACKHGTKLAFCQGCSPQS